MKKLCKPLYALFVLFLIFGAQIALADLEITEIMYNPNLSGGDYDWIEIHNNGDSSIDLTKYYFYADTGVISSTSTRHGIAGADILNSNEYAILSSDSVDNFKLKYNFSGIVFHSSFDISASIKTNLAITSDSNKPPAEDQRYEAICDPAKGANNDGNSLQKVNNSWIAALPTPGAINQTTNNTTNDTSNNSISTSNSTGGTATSIKKEPLPPKLTAEIVVKNLATAGVDLPIESSVHFGDKTYLAGKLVWNFGDGTTEIQTSFTPILHKYKYEGDYVLTLNYMNNIYDKIPLAKDRVVVSVVNPGVVISNIGNNEDFYIELENTSKYEFDLSNWVIKSGNGVFVIPDGTLMLPNKKLVLSSDITNFTYNPSASLSKPSGQIASIFPVEEVKSTKYIKSLARNISNQSEENTKLNNSVIDLTKENQTADVSNTGISFPIEIFGAILLAGIGIGATYFFTQKKQTNDNLLLDDNDIKIIE